MPPQAHAVPAQVLAILALCHYLFRPPVEDTAKLGLAPGAVVVVHKIVLSWAWVILAMPRRLWYLCIRTQYSGTLAPYHVSNGTVTRYATQYHPLHRCRPQTQQTSPFPARERTS